MHCILKERHSLMGRCETEGVAQKRRGRNDNNRAASSGCFGSLLVAAFICKGYTIHLQRQGSIKLNGGFT